MNAIHTTLLFAGLCALFQCMLTGFVIAARARSGVLLLHGGDQRLLRRIRAHGNFTETVPMALLLMALLEQSGLSAMWLWTLGATLLMGRALHAWSILTRSAVWTRSAGMILTIAVLSVAGTVCLSTYLRQSLGWQAL
jgi:uncharacterized protein